MGDGGAERRVLRPLGVDVDELVVVGDVGELVDLVLGDLEPLAGALVVADVGLEVLERLGCCFAHGADPIGASDGPEAGVELVVDELAGLPAAEPHLAVEVLRRG